MAKTKPTTVTVSWSAEEVCAFCGTAFRYKREAFRKSAPPCTGCGMTSQSWIGAAKGRQHSYLALGSGIILSFILLLYGVDTMSLMRACHTTGMIATMSLAGHLIIALRPSRKEPAPLVAVTELARSGNLEQLKTDSAFSPAGFLVSPSLSWMQILLFLLAGGLVCGIFSAEIVRRSNGWIVNPSINSAVVGPGDSFIHYFPSRSSVDGKWNVGVSSAHVKLERGRRYTLPGLSAGSNRRGVDFKKDDEGKIRINSIYNRSYTPWATVHLPDAPDFAWRQLELHIKVSISTMKHTGERDKDGVYLLEEGGSVETADFSIALSAAGAGTRYQRFWNIGGILGCCLFTAATALLRFVAR